MIHEHFPWSHETLSHYILYFSQLPRETTPESFRAYLQEFGEVAWLEVFKKPRCRDAFAHVLFETKESYERVFRESMHVFSNQKLRCAMWKRTAVNSCYEEILNSRKVFIKNLSIRYREIDIFKYFKQFGTIENIEMPVSHHNNQKRHIAYIVFRSESSVGDCLREKARIKKEMNFRVRAYKPEDSNRDDQQKQPAVTSVQDLPTESEAQQQLGAVPQIELIKKQQNPDSKTLFFNSNEVLVSNCCERQNIFAILHTKTSQPAIAISSSHVPQLTDERFKTPENTILDQNSTQASEFTKDAQNAKQTVCFFEKSKSLLGEESIHMQSEFKHLGLQTTSLQYPFEIPRIYHSRSYSISYFTVPGGI